MFEFCLFFSKRNSPWKFFEIDALVFDLNSPEIPETPLFLIELWLNGRLKNSLLGSAEEVSLRMMKAIVGDFEVQREHRFWFDKKDGEWSGSIRLGLEIGRSDATIVRHLQGFMVWPRVRFYLMFKRGHREVG